MLCHLAWVTHSFKAKHQGGGWGLNCMFALNILKLKNL
jgi:hypothetical protein